jgi:BASS family bile acid:Na+ symporter
VNNVLVAVFALQFFGAPVAALAALYNIPYYAGIVAIKRMVAWSTRYKEEKPRS